MDTLKQNELSQEQHQNRKTDKELPDSGDWEYFAKKLEDKKLEIEDKKDLLEKTAKDMALKKQMLALLVEQQQEAEKTLLAELEKAREPIKNEIEQLENSKTEPDKTARELVSTISNNFLSTLRENDSLFDSKVEITESIIIFKDLLETQTNELTKAKNNLIKLNNECQFILRYSFDLSKKDFIFSLDLLAHPSFYLLGISSETWTKLVEESKARFNKDTDFINQEIVSIKDTLKKHMDTHAEILKSEQEYLDNIEKIKENLDILDEQNRILQDLDSKIVKKNSLLLDLETENTVKIKCESSNTEQIHLQLNDSISQLTSTTELLNQEKITLENSTKVLGGIIIFLQGNQQFINVEMNNLRSKKIPDLFCEPGIEDLQYYFKGYKQLKNLYETLQGTQQKVQDKELDFVVTDTMKSVFAKSKNQLTGFIIDYYFDAIQSVSQDSDSRRQLLSNLPLAIDNAVAGKTENFKTTILYYSSILEFLTNNKQLAEQLIEIKDHEFAKKLLDLFFNDQNPLQNALIQYRCQEEKLSDYNELLCKEEVANLRSLLVKYIEKCFTLALATSENPSAVQNDDSLNRYPTLQRMAESILTLKAESKNLETWLPVAESIANDYQILDNLVDTIRQKQKENEQKITTISKSARELFSTILQAALVNRNTVLSPYKHARDSIKTVAGEIAILEKQYREFIEHINCLDIILDNDTVDIKQQAENLIIREKQRLSVKAEKELAILKLDHYRLQSTFPENTKGYILTEKEIRKKLESIEELETVIKKLNDNLNSLNHCTFVDIKADIELGNNSEKNHQAIENCLQQLANQKEQLVTARNRNIIIGKRITLRNNFCDNFTQNLENYKLGLKSESKFITILEGKLKSYKSNGDAISTQKLLDCIKRNMKTRPIRLQSLLNGLMVAIEKQNKLPVNVDPASIDNSHHHRDADDIRLNHSGNYLVQRMEDLYKKIEEMRLYGTASRYGADSTTEELANALKARMDEFMSINQVDIQAGNNLDLALFKNEFRTHLHTEDWHMSNNRGWVGLTLFTTKTKRTSLILDTEQIINDVEAQAPPSIWSRLMGG